MTYTIHGDLMDQTFPEQQEQHAMRMLHLLLPGILHELNNPMSYVVGNIESLQEYTAFLGDGARLLLQHPDTSKKSISFRKSEKPEKSEMSGWSESVQDWTQREDVELLLQDTEEIMQDMMAGVEVWSKIIDSLRLYLRKPRWYRERVDLHAILDKSLCLVQSMGQKKVEIRRKYGVNRACEGDPVLLCRAFVNVLARALAAVKQQSRAWIEIQISDEQEYVVVEVRDNGGVAAEETVKTTYAGTMGGTSSADRIFPTEEDLSLRVTEQIAIWHQGRLVLQSVPEQGTTISLYFPYC